MNSTMNRALGLFVMTLILAFLQDWRARDIAWSMWCASFVTGYIWIVATIIFANDSLSSSQSLSSTLKQSRPLPEVPLIARVVLSLFLLAFFTVHFGGFHLGHALFLSGFFPITDTASANELSGFAMHEPEFNIVKLILTALTTYWPFVALALVDKLPQLYRNIHEDKNFNMMAPYAAVMKNHFMIIALGFVSFIVQQDYILYTLLFFYFFPFSEVMGIWKARERTS